MSTKKEKQIHINNVSLSFVYFICMVKIHVYITIENN